jgi:hypothetical protein
LTWLERSGQLWKLRTSLLADVLGSIGVACFLGGVPRQSRLLALEVLGSFALLMVGQVTAALPKCAVCGLRLSTSGAARRSGPFAWKAWLYRLQACPGCGDDGSATIDSQNRWRISAVQPEKPYWTRRRVAIVLAAAASVPVVLYFVDRYVSPWYAARQH